MHARPGCVRCSQDAAREADPASARLRRRSCLLLKGFGNHVSEPPEDVKSVLNYGVRGIDGVTKGPSVSTLSGRRGKGFLGSGGTNRTSWYQVMSLAADRRLPAMRLYAVLVPTTGVEPAWFPARF